MEEEPTSFYIDLTVDPLLSLQSPGLQDGIQAAAPKGPTIWDKLREAIEKTVKAERVRPDILKILPDFTIPEHLWVEDAVNMIYHDVAELYGWYFNPEDDRQLWVGAQAKDNKTLEGKAIPFSMGDPEDPSYKSLRAAVEATVKDNLDELREIGDIPVGQDTAELDGRVTDNLTRYIINWPVWLYDRYMEESIDDYFDLKAEHEEIYDSEYGQLSNILDVTQFDGVTDVPYIWLDPQ